MNTNNYDLSFGAERLRALIDGRALACKSTDGTVIGRYKFDGVLVKDPITQEPWYAFTEVTANDEGETWDLFEVPAVKRAVSREDIIKAVNAAAIIDLPSQSHGMRQHTFADLVCNALGFDEVPHD